MLTFYCAPASGVDRVVHQLPKLFNTFLRAHHHLPGSNERMDRMPPHYSLEIVDEVTSTQDLIRDRNPRDPHGVIANRQSAGRGRHGRGWRTAPRAVAVSLGWQMTSPTMGILPLLAGLAARRVVGGALKWPNDVLIDGDKVAGILAERGGDLVIVGMGVNLWWPDPPDGWGAIKGDPPAEGFGVDLATRWIEHLLELIDQDPWPIDDYRAVCVTLGQEITWEPTNSGTAVDIAPDGSLVVETASGREQIHSGEIRNLRSS
ncbi:MAG: biotin--[acetyl-CoA-carboxylase] ligase [Acidimicrobiia bacterium]|nr:biotin--[acetyl-CoA-carboxylase] ligase [Acidimicrobiia bacterium]